MALNPPKSQDVQDIQFKLHDKFNIFSEGNVLKSLVSLLAVSSAKGLLFASSAVSRDLKVFKIRDIVDSKTLGQALKVRVINLPGEPKVLACSCDGSMLAVNYILNNTGFLQIYEVNSFVTPNPIILYNFPVAPDNHTFALQLLWNPVIPNNIALILTDGSVTVLTLNNGGQYDKVTLGKEHQVKCGCWSPKGKQIVFGFAEGKLQQFKPNLQPARAVPCPAGIHPGPFDCIAVHWLSTFQFAAIFIQRGQDMCPSLFIINAPKAGSPVYINYYDVCYSAPGPRIHQLSFNHIAAWNLLLVTSANGVEVGVLGTTETGETPSWIQYTLLDEARIELPLTESNDETYPLGFVFDNSSSHQIVMGEKKLPVMPMIHVLSTHSQLVSYNFLNLSSNAVDVCSPPPPLNDISGQFVPLSNTITAVPAATVQQIQPKQDLASENKQIPGQSFNDMTFSLGSNVVTSTPAFKEKATPLFGSQTTQVFGAKPVEPKPATAFIGSTTSTVPATAPTKTAAGFGFGAANSAPTNVAPFSQQFGGMTTAGSFGGFPGTGFAAKPTETGNPPVSQQTTNNNNKQTEVNKPLYTVPPTFTPPNVPQQQQITKTEVKPIKPIASSNKFNLNTGEIDEVVKQMIVIQIEAFETELKQIRHQSKRLMENIGSPNELKSYTKKLNDLQEIIEQANDHEFEQDVQSLRHSMNESYAMLAECRTKLDLYNNPNLTCLSTVSSTDPTSRRQLAKLQANVATNQNQLSQLNQLVDAQWSQYQDVVRRNTKNQMHIPCLDGIYQRMSKLKDLLSRQRTKMNFIKTKLKQKGLNYKPAAENDVTSAAVGALTRNQSTMESLADSILSMSLSQVVSQTHAKLSEEKLNAIRDYTKRQQQIAVIKPKRPDRIGLKSEVILETKLETERKQKEMAKKQIQQQQQQFYQQQYNQQQQQLAAFNSPVNYQQAVSSSKAQQQQNYQIQQMLKSQANQQQQPVLAKPTASKPPIVSSQPPTFITPTSSTAATLSFGGNSSFVKTSLSAAKYEETIAKPVATSTCFAPFNSTTLQEVPGLNINALQSTDGKENKTNPAPISFAAKIIGGNDTKSFTNLSNKTATQSNILQPTAQNFSVPASAGFSAFATTKPTTQNSNQDKDKAKKAEEAAKPFSFNSATTTISSPTANAFAGFSASTKSSTATTGPSFSATPLFSSNTTTAPAAATPFAALSTSSSFSFNATVTTAPTQISNSAANNSTKAVTTTTSSSQSAAVVTAKPAENKSTASLPATPAVSSTNNSNSSTSSNTTTITGSKSSVAPNVIVTSSSLPEAKTATTPTSTTTQLEDSTDSLFSSLNIYKPTPKEAEVAESIFSGLPASTSISSSSPFSFAAASGATDLSKSSSSSVSTSTGPAASTGFSFISAAAATPTATTVFGTTPTGPSAVTSASATTTSSATSTAATTTVSLTSASTTIPATSSFSFTAAAGSTVSTAGSLFGSLSVSPSTAASTAAPTASTTTSAASDNIFSGGSSIFGQTATVASTTSTTASIFGGAAAVASSGPSLFGSTAPVATQAATPGSGSIFASAAAATSPSGSIFGGIPKPEQTVFGSSNANPQPAGTGLFAAAAASTKPAAATGGSIFGGSPSTGFGAPAAGSIFGGGTSASSSPFSSTAAGNTAGSLFGAAAAASKPAEGGNIFGSPTQQSAASGGSIFSKPTFGGSAAPQAAGNIFGGGNAQSPTSGGFGASGGSIFANPSGNASASGGSLFGAAAAAPAFGASATSPGFGSFSQSSSANAFGSPTAGGFGAPASSGFGSPQQQSAFAKPLFGGPATFGSPQPAFGAQATFGGAPTFGSPKGFGSFATVSPPASNFGGPNQNIAPAAPKGNIFETLGSQDSGLSFGNLAHSTQAPQAKPTFGGSSFMNYRS